MVANRRKIVCVALDNSVDTDAAVTLAHNAGAVTLWVVAAVHKEAGFYGLEISAHSEHFLHKEHGTLLKLPDPITKHAVALDFYHVAKPVHG